MLYKFEKGRQKPIFLFVFGKRASLIVDITLFLAPFLSGNFVSFDNRIWNAFHNKCDLFQAITWLQKSCQVTLAVRKVERKQYPFNYLGLQMNNSQTMNKFRETLKSNALWVDGKFKPLKNQMKFTFWVTRKCYCSRSWYSVRVRSQNW